MQDSLFARAKRGDLPDDLNLEDIARLSSASLDAPNGVHANDDPLLLRLHRLVRAGLLVPTRSEQVTAPGRVLASFGGQRVGTPASVTTRHYVQACDLVAHLADLGAVGPLLLDWMGTAPSRPAPKDKGSSEPWHVPVVRDFCETVLASGEIDPDHPEVTAKAIVEAMKSLKLWHRGRDGHRHNEASLERYVRDTAGKFFVFPPGRPKGDSDPKQRHLRAVARLVAIYGRAKPETLTRTGPESASSFRDRSAG